MKWVHLKEWYLWMPCTERDSKELRSLRHDFSDQYMCVSNDCAARLAKTVRALQTVVNEITAMEKNR